MVENNISVYTSSGFPYGGAPENFVRSMVSGLKENNQRVRTVLFRGNKGKIRNNNLGINVSYLIFKRRQHTELIKILEIILLQFAIPISLIKSRFIHKTTIILIYGIDYLYYLLPFIIWTKLLNMKSVRIITDSYPKYSIAPVWWKKPKTYFYNIQSKKFDYYFDGVVFLSKLLKDKYVNQAQSNNNITVIPHFIDISQFNTSRDYELEEKIITIGYCGSVSTENGILDLLKAFDLVNIAYPNVKLMIIGKVKINKISEKQNFSKLVNLNKQNIILTEKLEISEIAKHLGMCHILVNPRISGERADSGFPTKLGEYFASKRPVVATLVGDIGEYFTDGKEAMLCNPDSPQELAEKIKELISSKELRNEIAINGFKWATENIEYSKSSKDLLSFIAKL